MWLDWACIAVDTARGSDATPPANHMTAIICLCVTHRKTTRRLSRRRRRKTKMLAIFHRMLDWFRSLFWKEEMELTLVGLQYSGKTTFVNVIAVSRQMNCSFSSRETRLVTTLDSPRFESRPGRTVTPSPAKLPGAGRLR